MAGLEELEEAIAKLPEEDCCSFRHWFLERDWERWDMQISEDSQAGKFDFLVREALDANNENKLRDL